MPLETGGDGERAVQPATTELAVKNQEQNPDNEIVQDQAMDTNRKLVSEADNKVTKAEPSAELQRQQTIDALNKELKAGGPCGKNCPWITSSLMAGACMGTGAFLFASNFSDQGLVGTGLLGPGGSITFISIRIFLAIRYRMKNGRWTKEKGSYLLTDGDRKIRWSSLIPIFASFLTNTLYLLAMSIGWKLAKASGLNQGVISTLLSLASVINIVIFYFKFGEKISAFHLIGVFLMIACIVCISMEATGSQEGEDGIDVYDKDKAFGFSKTTAGVLSILCGVFSAIMMSTKHLFIRLYKKTYSGIDQGVDSAILEFPLYCLFLIPLSQVDDFTIGWRELGIGAAAGTLIGLGRLFIAIGVSIGLAAPAQSLMSTHSLHQAFWSAAIGGQALDLLQFLGLGFGLCGVFSISYVDHLASKMKLKAQLKKAQSEELKAQDPQKP